ncbi:MAG: hypothetical protein M3O70_00010 [Actinomycetota bacterium]|nr:hypothetical protein [Actinomycetota bacterium]
MSIETAGRRGLKLRDVIARADAINHDIMAVEEFERGFGLLMAAGLIEEPDGLRPTAAGKRLLKRTGPGSWHERWPKLERALAELRATDLPTSGVSADEWDELVRDYVGEG